MTKDELELLSRYRALPLLAKFSILDYIKTKQEEILNPAPMGFSMAKDTDFSEFMEDLV